MKHVATQLLIALLAAAASVAEAAPATGRDSKRLKIQKQRENLDQLQRLLQDMSDRQVRAEQEAPAQAKPAPKAQARGDVDCGTPCASHRPNKPPIQDTRLDHQRRAGGPRGTYPRSQSPWNHWMGLCGGSPPLRVTPRL